MAIRSCVATSSRGGAACVTVLLAVLALAAPAASAFPTSGFTIWTVAGTGAFCELSESCGDGGPALGAKLSQPTGLALDGAGNLYIADHSSNRVRRVTPDGAIATIAGTGKPCEPSTASCGDGGPAVNAQIGTPEGIAVDAGGNVYVADNENSRIRKVSPAGTITTIAGTGKACAVPTTPCGDGGPAVNAELAGPYGMAPDASGNLYISDTGDQRIRRVSPAGTITTIAGTGKACAVPTTPCGDGGSALSAELSEPEGVAVDKATGNLYLVDSEDNRIRKVSPGGTITAVAGSGKACPAPVEPCGDGGPALSAELREPEEVALDGRGDLFISDSGDNRIREVTPDGAIATVAGTGAGCETANAPCGDGGAASAARLFEPAGLAIDGGGNVYVVDSFDNRVRWLAGPQPGPTGGSGPQGLPGLVGPAGQVGRSGAAGRPSKLVLVTFGLKVRNGRVSLRYVLTDDAQLTLTVKPKRGRSTVVARATGHTGVGQIAWTGKLRGKRPGHGRYVLTLAASAAGLHATSTFTVKL